MTYTATYSPDDNKLRLYASGRLDAETYARVKACGFCWAPKQELFVAPAWTPNREDLLIELAGQIDDEDTTLCERAEERAERFEDYSDKRGQDAERARKAVAAIADNIPLGQPILVGHHSERHARRDAEKIENGMRRAVKMWETSEYWTRRAQGALDHAKYKELPAVRARRIKGLEAEVRRVTKSREESALWLRLWELKPENLKSKTTGEPATMLEQARYWADRCRLGVTPNGTGGYWSAYDVLRPDGERYSACPSWTPEQVRDAARRAYPVNIAHCDRWLSHLANRLAYERAMLADAGGTVADRTGPEVGGGCRCWASPRGGWSYIKKVNKVSVTVLDNWGNGGRNFTRTIPLDKLHAIMTLAAVDAARAAGDLIDVNDGAGFLLRPDGSPKAPKEPEAPKPDAAAFEGMRQTLAAGVQVVSAPQLFPTPRDLAARMVELADIEPGHRVLEPSAGTGALLGAMGGQMFGHNPERGEVVAVEINHALASGLRTSFPLTEVHCADFLQCFAGKLGTFDRVLMNPPFVNAADVEHITRALDTLRPGGRLVAICANGPRQARALQPIADSWEELPADTFAHTGVRAVLLTINKGAA